MSILTYTVILIKQYKKYIIHTTHLYKKLYIKILHMLKNSLHRRNINEESNRDVLDETKNKMFNPPA